MEPVFLWLKPPAIIRCMEYYITGLQPWQEIQAVIVFLVVYKEFALMVGIYPLIRNGQFCLITLVGHWFREERWRRQEQAIGVLQIQEQLIVVDLLHCREVTGLAPVHLIIWAVVETFGLVQVLLVQMLCGDHLIIMIQNWTVWTITCSPASLSVACNICVGLYLPRPMPDLIQYTSLEILSL